ncbi:hypothetical protein ECDEC14A_2185 [Escherichia coli DEC14A]|nr:hypothetical protein ECDEC14A_2185 [Escherichia coli DEC14A]
MTKPGCYYKIVLLNHDLKNSINNKFDCGIVFFDLNHISAALSAYFGLLLVIFDC